MGWARLLPFFLVACTSLDEDPDVFDGGRMDARTGSDAADVDGRLPDRFAPPADAPGVDAFDATMTDVGGDFRDGCISAGDELCNAMDDDCNGRVDDGLAVFRAPVTYGMLTRFGCDSSARAVGACMEAARGFCIAGFGACSTSGAGTLTADDEATEVACIGEGFDEVTISFGDLTKLAMTPITSSTARTRVGQSAVHEWCLRNIAGAVAGLGPTYVDDMGGERLRAICLQEGQGAPLSVSPLMLAGAGCTYPRDAETVSCSAAADQLCQGADWEAGIGPISSSGITTIVCFGG